MINIHSLPCSLLRGCRKSTSLLASPGCNSIHQRWRESIVGRQADGLELCPDLVHARRQESLLNNGRHKGRELGLLPALLRRELGVHEVEAVEGVLLLDASVQVDATVAARVSLNSRRLVDDLELIGVGRHRDAVAGDDSDEREEGTGGLPALGAATGVVVDNVAGESHHDGVGSAMAADLAASEAGIALGDAIVEEGVERGSHCGLS
jgi:hypothetical protein